MTALRFARRGPRPALVVVLAAAAIVSACGGAAALVVPLFEFLFRAEAVVYQGTAYTVQMSLAPIRPTSATGNFTGGNLQVDDGAGGNTETPITGSYNSCTLQLALGANPPKPLAAGYDGQFNGRDTIVLTPNDKSDRPPITLLRTNAELLKDTMDC